MGYHEPVGRPRQRTPELRERFIGETLKLLESNGLEAITTRAVASTCDSSQAALHELFGSKLGLIDAAALAGFGTLRDALHETPLPADPKARVLALCRAHKDFSGGNPHLITLMYSRPFNDFSPDAADLAVASEILRLFTVEVSALIQAERRSQQVTDTAVGLIALLVGLHHQERSGTLGSTPATMQRRWAAAINRYITSPNPT